MAALAKPTGESKRRKPAQLGRREGNKQRGLAPKPKPQTLNPFEPGLDDCQPCPSLFFSRGPKTSTLQTLNPKPKRSSG